MNTIKRMNPYNVNRRGGMYWKIYPLIAKRLPDGRVLHPEAQEIAGGCRWAAAAAKELYALKLAVTTCSWWQWLILDYIGHNDT